ncbi:MAG TPA: hypothetical protein VME18_11645 [Acidobacteriaceae bacterium]|nr:hypothetical protein [Acidobacteriaceae bacterium]
MRIAIVTETFLPKIDGIVTMVLRTAEWLKAKGDEVLLLAPEGGPAEVFGAPVIGMPSVRFPYYPELRVAAPRASMRRHCRRSSRRFFTCSSRRCREWAVFIRVGR